ncbi:receptor-like protein kinase FERONIA [Ziziphus jujuba]|uniref:Receptor-like protein kinase FERONIA n=1 Tax=Ziziphus jujuba TaxID=326968 RepID=A0ABM4A6N6_ZIZJJ|nr:receptor-like protein kinase FERONIA [Ziziphus jujuba]
MVPHETKKKIDGPTNKSKVTSLPSDICCRFSLVEIRVASSNFDHQRIIGLGGFGNVYRGYIDDQTTTVAIEWLKSMSKQRAHEFKTEIEMLSKLRHVNLVSLIGHCDDESEMILVYEYMAYGTLRDHLYQTENPSLPWKQRLQICIGSARGLHYLHTGAKHMIIHRDVKSTNLLLDEKWTAKVSDFVLCRMGPTDSLNSHVSTGVNDCFGYLDPEYCRRQQLTEKSDMYSFRVVLLEVLCSRPALGQSLPKEQVGLSNWALTCYRNGAVDQIMDPKLMEQIAPVCSKKFVEIAVSCVDDERIKRPSMEHVAGGLEFALQLQETAEKCIDGEDDHVTAQNTRI